MQFKRGRDKDSRLQSAFTSSDLSHLKGSLSSVTFTHDQTLASTFALYELGVSEYHILIPRLFAGYNASYRYQHVSWSTLYAPSVQYATYRGMVLIAHTIYRPVLTCDSSTRPSLII